MKTIKVENNKSESGFCIINQADFKDGTHVRFEEKKQNEPSKEKAEPAKKASKKVAK